MSDNQRDISQSVSTKRRRYLDGVVVVVRRHGKDLGVRARGAAYHGRHLRLAAAPHRRAPGHRQRLQPRRCGPERVSPGASDQRPGRRRGSRRRRHQLRHLDEHGRFGTGRGAGVVRESSARVGVGLAVWV